MPLRAVIFDLDETLLDSSALLSDRDARRWGQVFERLDEVLPFVVPEGEIDVVELPRLTAERGLKVGLLTHSPREYARELLSAHGISVEAMVTGSDGYAPKPDPAGLRAVMAELGVEPADTLYLGDSVGDFGAAASAGTIAVGVAWAEATPAAWRHGWPDFAISAPRRLLQLIDGEEGFGSWAEVVTSGQSPRVHWGSLMRLGNGVYGLGRYFPMGDRRFPAHRLSHLVLRAKDDPTAAADVAQIFKSLAENATRGPRPELILSVPPEADGYDRFALARAALAKAWDAHDGGGLLTMRYGVENYKHVARPERAGQNLDRFGCAPLQGERVVFDRRRADKWRPERRRSRGDQGGRRRAGDHPGFECHAGQSSRAMSTVRLESEDVSPAQRRPGVHRMHCVFSRRVRVHPRHPVALDDLSRRRRTSTHLPRPLVSAKSPLQVTHETATSAARE